MDFSDIKIDRKEKLKKEKAANLTAAKKEFESLGFEPPPRAKPTSEFLQSQPIQVHEAQRIFLENDSRWKAFIGGRGSGKTFAGCLEAQKEAGRQVCTGAIVAPTFPMLRDGILPLWNEIVPRGLIKQYLKSEMTAIMANGSRIIFRSADDPDRLRGLNLSWFWLDEAAYMDRAVWAIATATLREKGRAGKAWITTTPAGFNWIYDFWVKNKTPDHFLIQCNTQSNLFTSEVYRQVITQEHGAGWFKRQEIEGAFIEPGGGINISKIKIVQSINPYPEDMIRYWDTAGTAGGGDYTVGVLFGRKKSGGWIILDVVRGQWSSSEVDRRMAATAMKDGKHVRIFIEQEPGSSGKRMIEYLVKMLAGYSAVGDQSTGSKSMRIAPLAAQLEVGNIDLLAGTWNEDFLSEAQAYGPRCQYDDQLDAAAGAFAKLGHKQWVFDGYRTIQHRRVSRGRDLAKRRGKDLSL
jgi:predicted phage terminase large subunit-like protein